MAIRATDDAELTQRNRGSEKQGIYMKIEYENIPDLSHIKKLMPSHILGMYFLGEEISGFKYHALIVNIIRLTDLAISEYEIARLAFREWAVTSDTIKVTSFALSSGHFEYCIDALNRALNHLESLRSLLNKHPNAPESLKDFISHDLNRKYKSLIYGDDRKNNIVKFRNAIQHMERNIKNGVIVRGESITLWIPPDANYLEIGSQKMSFDDLKRYLLDLYSIAGKLSAYSEPKENAD